MKRAVSFAAAAVLLSSVATGHAETVLLSMKGPGAGNPFWAAVEAGAIEKAAELGVDLVVLAPPQESDIQSQINQVEDQLAKGIDALAIAPTDPNALAPIVDQAKAAGVGGPVDGVFVVGVGEVDQMFASRGGGAGGAGQPAADQGEHCARDEQSWQCHRIRSPFVWVSRGIGPPGQPRDRRSPGARSPRS